MTTRGRQTSAKVRKGNSTFPLDRSCYVSSRIHSHFPTLERDGATVMKVGGMSQHSYLQMNTLGTASSPWIGDNHRVPMGYCGPREPGYSCWSCLVPGTTTQPHLCSPFLLSDAVKVIFIVLHSSGTGKDLLPVATMKPTHSSHVPPR